MVLYSRHIDNNYFSRPADFVALRVGSKRPPSEILGGTIVQDGYCPGTPEG